jgi:hypothetical protein
MKGSFRVAFFFFIVAIMATEKGNNYGPHQLKVKELCNYLNERV